MDAGTLTEWRIKRGDTVKHGDVVGSVETSKGIIDIEIYEDGVVDKLLVQPGQTVPVGTTLAVIRGAGESPSQPAKPATPEPSALERPPQVHSDLTGGAPSGTRQRVSPLARRRAEVLGVSLAGLKGTGPQGAVSVVDVEAAAAGAPAAPKDARQGMREAIGAAMARSKREIPHYYLATAVPVDTALSWLEKRNAEVPVTERMIYSLLFLRAVARALARFPEFNGYYRDGAFQAAEAVHVGVAISLRGGGLVAPALKQTATRDLGDLMTDFRDLVTRSRTGRLRSSEYSEPTITVTSLGDQGVETVYPVIYPPQVAIVGFGSILERPWAEEGTVKARRVVRMSLAADHRVSDGHRGALFLAAVGQLLQDPDKL